MKRVLKQGPGVLAGISVNEAHKDESVLFYDGDVLVLEIELNEAYPSRLTTGGVVPGLELDPPLFFANNIIIKHSKKIDIEPSFA